MFRALENERLNKLILSADIPWTYVTLIRALKLYAKQIRVSYAEDTIHSVLLRHGDAVRSLTELFRVRFDPQLQGASTSNMDEHRMELINRARRALKDQLDAVQDLTSHQVLSLFENLIEAALRTNFFASDMMVDPTLALKLNPELVTRMPQPQTVPGSFCLPSRGKGHPPSGGADCTRGHPLVGIAWPTFVPRF